MLDHSDTLLKLREKLLTVVVASTGVTTLEATTTGYVRTAGSFITDGFIAGLEVVPSGFTDNTVANVKTVSALSLTIDATRTAEASGGGRSLTTGVPVIRAFENVEKKRVAGRWYLREEYIPGPGEVIGVGPTTQVEYLPQYLIHVEGLADVDAMAMLKMEKAILTGFPPMLAIVLDNNDIVRVRTEPAPYAGQILSRNTGAPESVITIPLVARTSNPI